MTQHILTGLFTLIMIANVVAFVRHWRMMRVMEIVLNNLIETQKDFDRLVTVRDLPEAEREAAIRAMVDRYR